MRHNSFTIIFKHTKFLSFCLIWLSIILIAGHNQTIAGIHTQSSASYRLLKQTVGVAAQRGNSTNYRLNGTLGQPSATSRMTSVNYRLSWGYWQELGISNWSIYLPIVLK